MLDLNTNGALFSSRDMCNIENEVTKNQFFVAMDLVTRSIRGEGLASLPLASLRSSTPCLVTGTPAPSSLPLSPINNFQQAQNVPQVRIKLLLLRQNDKILCITVCDFYCCFFRSIYAMLSLLD